MLYYFCNLLNCAWYLQVGLKIKLFTGSSLKDVALEVAIDLQATWVILDRSGKL